MTAVYADTLIKTKTPSLYQERVFTAMRIVINHTITDAFDLTPEETDIASVELNNILSSLRDEDPQIIPLPVRHEMQSGLYSQRLAKRATKAIFPQPLDPEVSSGSLDDWTKVLVDTLNQCYEMNPFIVVRIETGIKQLLSDLGVGNSQRPRAARYLPNSVKYILAHKN